MRLHELLGGVDEASWRGDRDVDVDAVVHDSRDARPGALFCCVPGEATDGHLHAPEAVRAGAVALLVERFLDLGVPEARVPSVRSVLGPVAARFHGFPSASMRLIGITGTNGKTTTTYLLDSIGRAAGERTAVIGTVGTRIGDCMLPQARTTPEATDLQALLADARDAGVTTAAMEVSSHALDLRRVDGCEFAAAGFTNLGHDHLDWHGTTDAYFEAKARLFTSGLARAAAINVDDARGHGLAERAERAGVPVIRFGRGADVEAVEVDPEVSGTSMVLLDRRDGDGCREVALRLPLVGAFNVSNAVAAAATALAAGLPWEAIGPGLEAASVVPGRLEAVPCDRGFRVFVDYAHTPDALARVLDTLRDLTGADARVIVVFGAGGDRDREKRPLMGVEVARRADRSFLTSDNPRSEDPAAIAADVLGGVPGGRRSTMVVELDRRIAIRCAIAEARPGDVVLVAGKGHESGQTAGGVTVPFDDVAVVREELEAIECA